MSTASSVTNTSLKWRMRRRKRFVRVHTAEPSYDGILLGRWGGHYILEHASLREAEDRTVKLEGRVEIPAERVMFVQVLAKEPE
jgi:hypothetical protein